MIPSTGAVAIVQSAEKAIQRLMNMSSHIVDTQHGIDNHFTTLMSIVVEAYKDLRQHHISKMFNVKKQAASMSQKFNKLILFKGQ